MIFFFIDQIPLIGVYVIEIWNMLSRNFLEFLFQCSLHFASEDLRWEQTFRLIVRSTTTISKCYRHHPIIIRMQPVQSHSHLILSLKQWLHNTLYEFRIGYFQRLLKQRRGFPKIIFFELFFDQSCNPFELSGTMETASLYNFVKELQTLY